MQFHSIGRTYKAVSITGPTHNYLEVELALPGDRSEFVVVEPRQIDIGATERLSADEVRKWSAQGVQDANRQLGTSYQLRRVSFVPSDSPSAETYREMARRIVLRIHRNGSDFNGSEP